jgi:hypothetical protein
MVSFRKYKSDEDRQALTLRRKSNRYRNSLKPKPKLRLRQMCRLQRKRQNQKKKR